jgi:hypothetical protein
MVQFSYDYLGFFILLQLLKWSLVSNAYFYENSLAQNSGYLWELLQREMNE